MQVFSNSNATSGDYSLFGLLIAAASFLSEHGDSRHMGFGSCSMSPE